ncbi:prepilin-type N-terminal cleavage/methylation domain-containing protein [Okeanomitos corallinicola TIOX110]|uniref:Prepilin-type N-terminal cleavage/methylation domain-containing protein n=1 Tax=Okeanomitos corallinicola TIOX110 TaxID=3133117 RepID=A0ABZ2USN3_9CYAN
MNKQKPHPDSGFSLLEVLVSIIVVTFFTAAAMQMMVISATFKAKAKVYTTASNLIQEDLERIRNKASEYEFPQAIVTTADVNGLLIANPNTRTIKLSSVENLTTSDEVQFTGTPDVYKDFSINSIDNEITLALPGLETSVSNDTVLVNNTLCNAASESTGLAAKLRTKTVTDLISQTGFSYENVAYKAVSGYAPYTIPKTEKKIWVMREDTTVNASPYDVLKINYLVVPDNNGNPDNNPDRFIAEVSSEVIPNASYQCLKQ